MRTNLLLALTFGVFHAAITVYATTTPTIRFRTSGLSVEEGHASTLEVVCTSGFTNVISVDYATTNGTDRKGTNYVAVAGTLIFKPGETNKSITVSTINNGLAGLAEANKSCTVALSNPGGGAVIGSPSRVVLSIWNNDEGFSLSKSSETVDENAGFANLTIHRGDDLDASVSVDWYTTNLTATSGIDY